jgi:putative ABC transport system permease protein
MPFREAIRLALESIRTAKLRSFFTLLGIIVSVGFLVTVVAIIQGMNAYVSESLTGAMIGTNSFQVRRAPIALQLMSDQQIDSIEKRPLVTQEDAAAVRAALPDARAVALQSGWPTPSVTVTYRNKALASVMVFGVTPEYQVVQDYRFAAGDPLFDPDVRERRQVAVVGYDIADKLFDGAEQALGKVIRVGGFPLTIKGVIAAKGRMLGQSFDGFVLTPLSTFESIFGRRLTTTVSVKMDRASDLAGAMARAEEAMRVAHRLRPTQGNDIADEKADALVAFWTTLTSLLLLVVPAVVEIGIVVGGIVIMYVMLLSVR